MRLTVTVDIPDDQLRELFRRATQPHAASNGRVEHDEPPDVQAEPGPAPRAMDGHELLEWIRDQPDPDAVKSRAVAISKKLGYGWKLAALSPAQVEEIRSRLAKAPAPWGGAGQ